MCVSNFVCLFACVLQILKVTFLRRFEAVQSGNVLNSEHQGGLWQQNAVHVDPVDGIAEGHFLQTVFGVEEAACEQPTGSASGRSPPRAHAKAARTYVHHVGRRDQAHRHDEAHGDRESPFFGHHHQLQVIVSRAHENTARNSTTHWD